ncbi:transketolase [Suillus spraguei]|nr:transketolase [Suillus spraguei]
MSQFTSESTDNTSIATIRTLAADVVGKANSGHPGAPMGMAPVSHVLFTRFFNANPKSSKWFNRDRFVLSNGCALQYILLHLLGYKLSMDDLKAFRQIDSLTPGHPEANHTDGIEVTTGPLGQGFANGVGLAMAQAHLGAVYNRPGFDLINNYTYVFTGDGCLMEGVASEAASLAGHLQLGNLIVVRSVTHPHQDISIDGDTAVAFTENVEQRFMSYGWQVLHVSDGDHDLAGIYGAIVAARAEKNKPTIICLKTTIGHHGVHGSPLKADDIQSLKSKFGFPPEEKFYVPQETYDTYRAVALRGAKLESQWNTLLAAYAQAYPKEHAELTRRISGKLPEGWEKKLPVYTPADPAQASRKLSELVLTAITPALPDLIGGSADLTGSNLTKVKGTVDFQPPSTGLGSYAGTYIRYGVREHGMGAIANGLHAMNFVSYAVGAVRLSALSKHQVIWVATHDSIGLGEDGPTHQPIETGVHLRAIPNLDFWRPADGNETSAAYLVALKSTQTPSGSTIERAARGGYVLYDVANEDMTIVSSGSEVPIALEAASLLKKEGINVRLVSLPCWSVFDKQDQQYRLSVLRSGAPILSLEALTTTGWQKYSHEQYGLPAWGASGPYLKVYEKFGITGPNIAAVSKKVIAFYKQKGGEVVSPLVKAL